MHKVVFFGASVTAQRQNQQGETTGYFNFCQDYLDKHYPGQFAIEGFSSVGGQLDLSGRLMLLDIVEKLDADTLVVSEWNSTTRWFFPPDIMKFYYETLFATGARVLNLVIPMLSELGKERQNIKQVRAAQQLGAHQLNLYKEDLDFRACIRDEQHTTAYGGRAYGEIVARAIAAIMIEGKRLTDDGEILDFMTTKTPVPQSFKFEFAGTIPAGRTLRVHLGAPVSDRFQIFGKVMKGAWSPSLRTAGADGTIELWNKYSYYDHHWATLTEITGELNAADFSDFVDIVVRTELPDYETLAAGDEKSLRYMSSQTSISPRLVINATLYSDGRPIVGAEIV